MELKYENMKIKFIILSLLVCLFCFATCKYAVIDNNDNIEISEKDDLFDMIVSPEPMKHTSHTHEHTGLACCPCGACHKKDDDEQYEHGHIEFRPWVRVMSALLSCAVILSVIHGIF